MIEIKNFLRRLPAFERFNERQIDALVSQLRVETYASGTSLICQWEQGAALYIIVSGAIQVSQVYADEINVDGSGGQDTYEAHAGEMVGLLSLVPDMPSLVTCTAIDQIVVASLTFERYNVLSLLAPRITHQLQYMVASQLATYLQQQSQELRLHLATEIPQTTLLGRLLGVKNQRD
jgi:CRP-like cAMP-binding protein